MGEQNRARIVEVEPNGISWLKSSVSTNASDSCLEAAPLSDQVLVRSSHNRGGRRLSLSLPAWNQLLTHVRRHHVI